MPTVASRIDAAQRIAATVLANIARKPSPVVFTSLAQVALETQAHDAIVLAEPLLPGRLTQPTRGAGRIDDVGHQERRDDAILARRSTELLDVAEEVDKDDRFIADHPGVMPWGNIEDVVRLDLGVLAIVHLDGEPSGQQELKMVDSTEWLVGRLVHVRRPSPA